MKKLTMLLVVLMCLLAAAPALADAAFGVTLPADYETSARRYPVAYILPQDGYAQDDSGIAGLLAQTMADGNCTGMILVQPAFDPEGDPRAQMAQITADVDAQYRTIPSASHRALIGTGAGGYLAYAIGLTDASGKELSAPETYGILASVRGDFAGSPWKEKLGSVYDLIEGIHLANADAVSAWYTYMDAPVDDVYTDMPGSTNELGALFIGYGTGSAAHEYTARAGVYDEAFLAESVSRIARRITDRLLSGAAVGSVALETTTLTAEDTTASADFSVTLTDAFAAFCPEGADVEIAISVIDPKSGDFLTGAQTTRSVPGAGAIEGTLEFGNVVSGASADVVLSVRLLGTELDLAKATLIRSQPPVVDGEFQSIALLGDWYFNYVGAGTVLDVAALTPEEYTAWSVVQPTLGNWTKGYGNISDENVVSGYGPDYFDYFITGSGYYAKNFTVPEDFDAQELVLSVGYVDDRCEVFLNGVRVGATGMDENGQPTGETTWSVYSVFDVDPALLVRGGENTVVVRAWNDLPFGAGGWYGGPVGLYSRAAFERDNASVQSDRFFEASFLSAHAASALGQKEPVENKYLIYLPESYAISDRAYPTVYLLHQFNSDHTSYRGDRVNELLDTYAAQGLFDEMIVVIPNSSEESWWAGPWEKMITEELIPLIDSQYRTIRDARFRLTAGCSMGGQGAMAVALRNPDFFSGAVSFFGAFSYGGASSPNAIAAAESAQYMDSFSSASSAAIRIPTASACRRSSCISSLMPWAWITASSSTTAATTAASMSRSLTRRSPMSARTCTSRWADTAPASTRR